MMTVGTILKLASGRRLVGAVAAGSLGLTLLASLWSAGQVDRSSARELNARAATAEELIEGRALMYTEMLYGVSALRSSSQYLTRSEFHHYITTLEVFRRYPGVQVIGFCELMRGDRSWYEAIIGADADVSGLPYPPFAIRPAGIRPEYVPISFIEPQKGNGPAFGFDILSEPNRRAAMERTRDTGRPAATAPVKLIQETGEQTGFLIMLATYRPGLPQGTVAERRAAFMGAEYAAFRMGELLAGVLGKDPSANDLEIYDRGPAGATNPDPLDPDDRTYDTDDRANAFAARHEERTRMRSVEVAGRRWDVYYRANDALVPSQESAAPWVIAGLGVLLSILATWLFWMMSTARERALGLAGTMTAQLRESEQRLARSNRELERFAYVASHDLQEPLRTVTSFVGLLSQRYEDQLDGRAQRYIAFAVDATERMSRMISELLTYSRVGRTDDEPVLVDLSVAWDEAVANLSGAIEVQGGLVHRGVLPMVTVSRVHAVQLFQNLIGNALKYRSADPPEITASASLSEDGREWRVELRDNGIGIDAKHHERIFVIFQRLHTVEEYPGTGMGLAICKKIVESYGGRIWVESRPGEGSRFVFTLPVAASPAETPAAGTTGTGPTGAGPTDPGANGGGSKPVGAS